MKQKDRAAESAERFPGIEFRVDPLREKRLDFRGERGIGPARPRGRQVMPALPLRGQGAGVRKVLLQQQALQAPAQPPAVGGVLEQVQGGKHHHPARVIAGGVVPLPLFGRPGREPPPAAPLEVVIGADGGDEGGAVAHLRSGGRHQGERPGIGNPRQAGFADPFPPLQRARAGVPEEHLLHGGGGDLELPELPDVGGDHQQSPGGQQARQRHESLVIAAQGADARRKHHGGVSRRPGRPVIEGFVVTVPVPGAGPAFNHGRARSVTPGREGFHVQGEAHRKEEVAPRIPGKDAGNQDRRHDPQPPFPGPEHRHPPRRAPTGRDPSLRPPAAVMIP